MQQQLYLFIFNVIHPFPGPMSLLCRINWVLEHEDNRMHLAKFSQFFDGPVNLPYVYYFGKEQGLQSSLHFTILTITAPKYRSGNQCGESA